MMNMHVRHEVKAHLAPHIEYMYLREGGTYLCLSMYSVRRIFGKFHFFSFYREKIHHTTSYTYLPYLPFILVFAFEREKREVYIFGVRTEFESCQIIGRSHPTLIF